MKRSSSSTRCRNRSHHLKAYRPVIELLERRLPPGNLFSSLFLGGSTLALEIEKDKLDEAVSTLRRTEKPELIRETPRPELVANEASDIAVAYEPAPRRENSPLDSLQVGTSSPRPPAFRPGVETHRAAAMGAPSSALTAPAAGRAQDSALFGRVHLTAPQMATGGTASKPADSQGPSEAQESEILDNYGKMPVSFEQNVGRFDERVDFVSRGGGSTLFLTPTAAVFSLENSESRIQNSESRPDMASVDALARRARPEHVGLTPRRSSEETTGVALHMQIVGGNPDARPAAADKLPGITNYFIGDDPNQWRTNIASFGRVEYDEVYPGIDMAYYGNDGQLEYDFIVSPGADPSAIALNFAGADGMEINPQGDLVVHTAVGDVVQQKPFTYQDVGNARQEVASGYVMDGGTVRFQVGAYDVTQPLVIDPLVLGYSTFLGVFSEGREVAVDSAGSAYVTGFTSGGFPITPGAFDATFNGPGYDAFVTKLNAAGSGLVYSTFLGGSGNDVALGIAVDVSGSAYVTGVTESNDFPTTVGALDTTNNGGTFNQDGFITKLNAGGSALAYSTFLGGSDDDWSRGIALDGSGNAYVTGQTFSPNFPTTPGAFDTTLNYVIDAFVTKLNANGSALAYSTYLGGTGFENYYEIYEGDPGIAVDGSGNAYVTGNTDAGDFPTTPGAFDTTFNGFENDAFVTKLNAAGSALIYSTFLGGTADDRGYGIALDSSGNAYVTGTTEFGNFPTTPGAFDTSPNEEYDTFVTKLNGDGSALVYSTFLGGWRDETGVGIAVDGSGNAYVTGWTYSWNLPTTPGALDPVNNAYSNAYVTKLNAAGSGLAYSSLLGGSDYDGAYGIAVDNGGNAYVLGVTGSSDFPTTPGAFDTALNGSDGGFVTKFRVAPPNCGCFETHNITTSADGAYSVFAADVDGDGDTDVLAAEHFDARIAWYENNGSQSFTAHTITPAAFGAVSVFAADVDSDGDTDVLSASRLDNKIAWYENSGGANPSFTAHTISTAAADARSVYAADVNGDGEMDVLSASALDDKITWYRNNGSESFFVHTITTAANGARSVITEDVDGDGDTDILSASYYDNKIAWYENTSQGFTATHTITTAASGAESVFTADVDGDGDIDVLSASIVDNKIAWYENDGSIFSPPSFTAHVITTTFVNLPKDVYAADIDADGDIDVLSASVVDNKIAWYKNDGGVNPSFTAHTITTAAVGAVSVLAADVDSDGDTDVLSASANDDKIAWYENHSFRVVNTSDSGSGSLRQAMLTANANPGVDTITFDIGTGVQTIAPTSALPAITDPVVIDGTTQPGYVGTPLVVLSGVNIPATNGLFVTAGGSTIRGLGINGFTSGVGIFLKTNGGNLVVGNYIGTNAAGTAAIGNGIGIYIDSGSNTVGGTTATSRNLISGNGTGIFSTGSNVIQGNYIGTDASGTSALGNQSDGVSLFGSNNVVGGTTAEAGNRIAFNGGVGVYVDTFTGNAIRQNTIYSNGGLGIALTNGGNGNQNKPAVNLATSGGGTTTISVTLVSTPNTTFTLDFFSSSVCDPSTFGEGETYLGSKTLTTKSTGRGRTIFVAGVEVPVGHVITATATSPGNNTSEFSKCWTVT